MSAGFTRDEREAVATAIDNRIHSLEWSLKQADETLPGGIAPSVEFSWREQLKLLRSARDKLPRLRQTT